MSIATPLLISTLALYYRSLGYSLQGVQCTILSASLPGRVSYPSSAAYTSSLASYWTALESALRPSCVVTPRDTNDVAVAMKVLRWLPLQDSCKVAIRGGGHTPWAGSANIEGGITIDLRSLKAISVNQEKSIVSVAAGCVWGEVHRRTDELGLAVIGGRGSTIGVGGLTLGGESNLHALDAQF
jgi:FAD/FMN-containing dehydrogenase